MENVNLTGHFLIAMPAMTDPYFARSVTYICEHNAQGAMGVVINRPIEMRLDDLFDQIHLEISDQSLGQAPVHFGGPVQIERGFVLHQPVGHWSSSMSIDGHTALTTSKDILEASALGVGPEKMLVTLGYAGWSAGQLEEELAQNAWLTVPADDTVIFETPSELKFDAAIRLLGIDPAALAEDAGHA